jgi:hypothetical protein
MFASVVINKTNQYYQAQLSKQLENRNKLRNQELKLIKLNNSLLTEIRLILSTFKNITLETQSQQQLRSSRSIARSSTILQKTLLVRYTNFASAGHFNFFNASKEPEISGGYSFSQATSIAKG